MKRSDGSKEIAHTNDATVFAFGRLLSAIIENYQTENGFEVPDVFRNYMGKDLISSDGRES